MADTPPNFENAVSDDGLFVIEWTDEVREIAKREGKRIVCSFKGDGRGGIIPQMSYIDVIDTPIQVESTNG